MQEKAFVAALLDPELPVPEGLIDPAGQPATRRFSVYRNNVAGGLIRALEAGFPVVRKLVGDEFFAALAGVFFRAHPPTSRILMLYGAQFPDFLADFPPVARLGYLPDVAQLEQAIRESYHAADHQPAALSEIAPAKLLQQRFRLGLSAKLIRSSWPVYSIWHANMRGGGQPEPRAEDVLVLRKGFDPEPHLLPPSGAALVQALANGERLTDAIDLAGAEETASEILGLLMQSGAIAEVWE